jgi:hypothetical protein
VPDHRVFGFFAIHEVIIDQLIPSFISQNDSQISALFGSPSLSELIFATGNALQDIID